MAAFTFAYKIYSNTILESFSMTPSLKVGCIRTLCSKTQELVDYLDQLKNFEKSGVPENAGTETDDGFDLGRMKRLMDRLGNPQSNYKTVHVAGTKGKGSTAAFLSNILRAEGYCVGCYTSPHIRTIRERMSVGTLNEPVPADLLHSVFLRTRKLLDQVVAHESGQLSHFEVLTAIAFTLFADQNVDIAVVEAGLGGARDATNIISSSDLAAAVITTVGKEHLAALGGSLESIALAKSGIIKHGRPIVLGGPFLPHIEQIIRDKALSMCSPVVSACDSGNNSVINGFGIVNGEPRQSCNLQLHIQEDVPLQIELSDVNLSMLGHHQLQNAVTATCAALWLRDQGWGITNGSIRSGLEGTQLLGRSQILKKEETEALGVPESMALLDGAHTQESAKALANTVSTVCQNSRLVLVVAMASDKDHHGFAKELLTGLHFEAVILTEVDIAGGKSRNASALFLRDVWIKTCKELGIEFDINEDIVNDLKPADALVQSIRNSNKMILAAENSLKNCIRVGSRILKARTGDSSGLWDRYPAARTVQQMLETMDRIMEEEPLPLTNGIGEYVRGRTPWDIKEAEHEYKMRFDMPGMTKRDVKIWVEEKMLVIKAEKVPKSKDGEQNGGVEHDEEDWPAKSYGKYSSRIALPENVEFEKIKAEVKDGVLYVTIPKASSSSKVFSIEVD